MVATEPLVPAMSSRLATVVVFATSFCVLVLEILAGRLLAPLVGVSLETFTGIIGTVLAGIATGSALGGRLADRYDPGPLVGPAIVVGGLLSWLAPVLISALGSPQSPDPITIVFLTAVTFFGPAAVLSSVSPMVAKLRLDDMAETGRVVGNLSAAGTVGALAGTFLTGFVLVAAFPTRELIFAVGLALVVGGAVLTGRARLARNSLALVVATGIGSLGMVLPDPCDAETAYACVELEPDPARPSGIGVVLNGDRNSYVDLDDPTYLEFRYMRLFADVTGALAEESAEGQPFEALHVGGAGFTYPRYLDAVHTGAGNTVLEIDAELVAFARQELALELSDRLEVRTGDARLTVADLDDDRYDVIVGDAFSGLTIPWHLTTIEFVEALDRVLAPDGVVVANLIDGGESDFVRAQLATYRARFAHVVLIVPPAGSPTDVPRNQIMIASHRRLPPIEVDPADGVLLSEVETAEVIGDAIVLADDYAPVDQLRQAR